MHSSSYTHNDIGKLLKKSIKKEFIDILPLPMAANSFYSKKDIINTVIYSVTNDIYVEYGSKKLKKKREISPSSDTIFYHLPKLDTQNVFSTFQQTNHMLLKQVEKHGIFNASVWCGLDIHKVPWFGKKKDKYVLGMERVRGTNFGHGYASLECVEPGKRLTFSALPLNQFTSKKKIIGFLINETRKYVKISRLFLDRGFFDVESIDALRELSAPFIIPVKRNKKIDLLIREFLQKCQIPPYEEHYSLIVDYELKKGKKSAMFTLVIIVDPPKDPDYEWDVFAYATNMPVNIENAIELADSYRSRWGIETGYRVKEEVRGKTCSQNYVIRLLLQLLSVLLYNLWQLCNLIVNVIMRWDKRGYLIILREFKDIISDEIIGG